MIEENSYIIVPNEISKLGIYNINSYFREVLIDSKDSLLDFLKIINETDFSVIKNMDYEDLTTGLPEIPQLKLEKNQIICTSFSKTNFSYNRNINYKTEIMINSSTLKISRIRILLSVTAHDYYNNGKSTQIIDFPTFSFHPGDKRFLISGKWVDKIDLEEKAFQMSTSENHVEYDLTDIAEIIKALGDLI